jgi:hypothetical protein
MDDLNQIICDYPNNNCLNSYNCLNFRLDSENRIVVTGVDENYENLYLCE